ncbi:hypothetical protein [Chamaesiphon sp. OTE_75_metabat_556]|uniref:hypothetical protein n=1 Tax=Chamaesiphon sp. OTE_75_metabat_556 TaxID=2964692 RepID=UPI00286C5F59|nr:hypothetical protein [Chamaesiphon sp. OTE_75_metabat_556]
MKIIIALLVPILLGIVVGSNLAPTIAIVIFNQPTISLPIGIWLTIAIGGGLLSSLAIQILITIDRRLLKRQVRQLQSRLQQSDEDIFTYTSPTAADNSSPAKSVEMDAPNESPPATKTSRFKSYRSNLADRFSNRSSAPASVEDDRDDWEDPPPLNRELDWEDSPAPRPQSVRSTRNSSTIENDRIPADRRTPKMSDRSQQTSREVYDADFRLIQPPYKEPLTTEFDDEPDTANFDDPPRDRDLDRSSSSVRSTDPDHTPPASNQDDEDWGFDFDDREPPARAN